MRCFAIATVALVAMFASAAADDRPPPTAEEVKTAKTHFDEGRRLIKKGKYPEAIKELEAAYALDPKNEQLFNLGVAHHLNKDLKAAADYYRRFLAVETKGRTVETARKHLAQIEKVLQAQEADDLQRAEVQRKADEQRLADEQRVKALRDAEDRERLATSRVAALEADLARAKLARDTQRGKAEAVGAEADAAEREVARWRASSLVAPSGSGRGMRALSTVLLVGGGAALGAGGWNGLRARELMNDVTSATAWTTELDQAVEDGEDADKQFQILVPVGGAAALLGLFALGFGESWSTDARDAKALERRIAGPVESKR